MKRPLFIILGTLFLGIGIIGIFVPVLPTTPFLLLATFFYTRSSERFNNWLLNNRVLGAYIRHYIDGRGISLRVKLFSLVLLWVTISFTVAFAINELAVKIILVLVAIGVSMHIALIKGYKRQRYIQAKKVNND